MEGRFTREELVEAGARLMQDLVGSGTVQPTQIPILAAQMTTCIHQILNQTDHQWSLVPNDATPDQLLALMYLVLTDLANGTDYADRLVSGRGLPHQGNDTPTTLDDLLKFDA